MSLADSSTIQKNRVSPSASADDTISLSTESTLESVACQRVFPGENHGTQKPITDSRRRHPLKPSLMFRCFKKQPASQKWRRRCAAGTHDGTSAPAVVHLSIWAPLNNLEQLQLGRTSTNGHKSHRLPFNHRAPLLRTVSSSPWQEQAQGTCGISEGGDWCSGRHGTRRSGRTKYIILLLSCNYRRPLLSTSPATAGVFSETLLFHFHSLCWFWLPAGFACFIPKVTGFRRRSTFTTVALLLGSHIL